MSKPPVGQKQCAHVDKATRVRCKETFEAIGRRSYCDKHFVGAPRGQGGPRKPAVAKSAVKAMVGTLVRAAEDLGAVEAALLVDEATAEVVKRVLKLREQLIKSRHEVQQLRTQMVEQKIARAEGGQESEA